MSAGKLAALGADGLWIEGARVPRRPDLRKAADIGWLFNGMAYRGIEVLHIHRSALALLELPEELPVPRPGEKRPAHPFVDGVRVDGKLISSRALVPSITAGKLEIAIGAYQDGAASPFEEAEDARELLAAQVAFTSALKGWKYRNSAAITGWDLMLAPWRYGPRAAKLAASEFEKNERPDLGDVRQVEVPYGSWARGEEVAGFDFDQLPYVSAWDVNGQRLSACSQASVGVGGLEHRKRPGTFDQKLPGYHRIERYGLPFVGLIPPVFEPGWHTTPRVAMAAYLGIEFEIEESWVWTEHVPYFVPWYERLRDARTTLMNTTRLDFGNTGNANRPEELALDALKECYLQPLGRLRSRRAQARGDLYYRPDWYDTVIGHELAREYLRLHGLASAGASVLAVYFDTIILETAEPGVAPPELPVSDQLGKYKLLGAIPTDAARAALYTDKGPNVAALIRLLKEPNAAPGGELSDPPRTTLVRPPHGGYPDV